MTGVERATPAEPFGAWDDIQRVLDLDDAQIVVVVKLQHGIGRHGQRVIGPRVAHRALDAQHLPEGIRHVIVDTGTALDVAPADIKVNSVRGPG